MDALVKCGRSVGVLDDNVDVFAKIASRLNRPVRAADCLRNFAHQCGATFPEKLTSAALRKHIARTSQLLNLENNELDILATFLGHDIRVHKEFYRFRRTQSKLPKLANC